MARDLCDCVPIVDWVCRRDSTEYYLCRLQRAKSVGSELVFQKSQVVTPRALSRPLECDRGCRVDRYGPALSNCSLHRAHRSQTSAFRQADCTLAHQFCPDCIFSCVSRFDCSYLGSGRLLLLLSGRMEGGSRWTRSLALYEGDLPQLATHFNSYGPLFNALAPLVWVNPLANKLLFAFSYLAYVIWLIKDLAPRRGFVTLSWPWLSLWILNPFPWVQIAYFGYFDVLVALACVAAVHSLISKRDGVSGICLAVGVLLKYMPIVILPFLVFSERRFHFRLLSFCVGVVIFGLAVSTLIWGPSTFLPLALAALRQPAWSIYDVLASTHSPLRLFWEPPNSNYLDWLEKPFLVTAGLGVFAWCVLGRIGPTLSATLAILVILLLHRTGQFNYQMLPFLLISYWMVSEWEQLREHSFLAALLFAYFCLLAIFELIAWSAITIVTYTNGDTLYGTMVMLKFLLNCALLVRLAQFSAHHRSIITKVNNQARWRKQLLDQHERRQHSDIRPREIQFVTQVVQYACAQ